jgi:hypothetical protein
MRQRSNGEAEQEQALPAIGHSYTAQACSVPVGVVARRKQQFRKWVRNRVRRVGVAVRVAAEFILSATRREADFSQVPTAFGVFGSRYLKRKPDDHFAKWVAVRVAGGDGLEPHPPSERETGLEPAGGGRGCLEVRPTGYTTRRTRNPTRRSSIAIEPYG